MIRVLCVEDHGIVRDALIALLNLQKDMRVVAAGRNGTEAVRLYAEFRPDITVMDLELPDVNGAEATRRICAADANARIIILTVHQGNEDIFKAVQAGAVAYLFKDALTADLTDTIRRVYDRTYSLPPAIAARLREREDAAPLTPREIEVVDLMLSGMSNKTIALTLGISADTVHAHVRNIFTKLEVTDRMSAVNVAIRRGLVHRQ